MKTKRSHVKEIAITIGLIAAMISPGFIQVNAATPLPVVHGPLPVTADSYPFGAADHTLLPTDLKKIGYVAPEFFRNYEIAGSAHATPDELNFAASPEDIIRAGRTVPAMRCNEGPRSRFPNSIAFNAILQNLKLWAIEQIPPPRAEPIKVENGKPVLDEYGNAVGGVRSPYVDVPTSIWLGSSTGESFCFIAGHEAPFDRAQLKKLYPNHKAYVNAVAKNLSSLVAQRFVTKADAKKLLEEAKKAAIPSGRTGVGSFHRGGFSRDFLDGRR